MRNYRKLTQKQADSAKPREREYTIWDYRVPGFGLRVRPTGARTYVLVYRMFGRRQRRITIGKSSVYTVAEALDQARRLRQDVYEGRDPRQERIDARTTTIEEQYHRYLRNRLSEVSRNHRIRVCNIFESEILPNLGHMPIGIVSRLDVRLLTESVERSGRNAMANNVHRALSAFFGWCYRDEWLLPEHPLSGMRLPNRPNSRARFLTPNELGTLWHACDKLDPRWRGGIRLLVLTGQRKSEVFESELREFDLHCATWTIPANRTKNGHQHTVHLSHAALEVIAEIPKTPPQKYLFQSDKTIKERPICGDSRAGRRIKTLVPFNDWWLHDLRRSVATHMASLAIPPHVIQVVLNHRSGFRSGVTAIYNRYEYNQEAKDAWRLWGSTLEKWVTENDTYIPEPTEDDSVVL